MFGVDAVDMGVDEVGMVAMLFAFNMPAVRWYNEGISKSS
jgi:hypothetical protein